MTRIHVGDALEVLRGLPAGSVQCCVTSPPYWGLRAYQGDAGMIGLEATFDEHLTALVAVFREVRRVLREDGTCWLNYGDAYAHSTVGAGGEGKQHTNAGSVLKDRSRNIASGLKPKDLMMMPARVALALQADGWWLRSEIVWHKPNPMPESVTDRPTSAHEKLYLLTKAPRYFYDAEAVRTAPSPHSYQATNNCRAGLRRGNATPDSGIAEARRRNGADPQPANLRNVWSVPTHSFSGWTETCRLAHVEPDAASDDTMRIASPDCREHADQPDRVPKAFCGERAARETARILGMHGRPFRVLRGGLAPIDQHRGCWIVGENSGSLLLAWSRSASRHSSETHRTDPAPSTTSPCIACGETSGRTAGTSDVTRVRCASWLHAREQ